MPHNLASPLVAVTEPNISFGLASPPAAAIMREVIRSKFSSCWLLPPGQRSHWTQLLHRLPPCQMGHSTDALCTTTEASYKPRTALRDQSQHPYARSGYDDMAAYNSYMNPEPGFQSGPGNSAGAAYVATSLSFTKPSSSVHRS
jgi:hypothetical protein